MKIVSPLHCRDITFIIGLSLFITLLQNTRFFTLSWQFIEVNSVRTTLFFISMFILLFCCLNIIFTLILVPYFRKTLAIAFILIGAAANYFMYSFNIVIDRTMTQNALETHPTETADLLTFDFFVWLLLLGILPATLMVLTRIQAELTVWRFILKRGMNIVISALVVFVIAAIFYKDYAPFFRNNKSIVNTLTPSNVVGGLINNASNYLDSRQPFVHIGLDAQKKPPLTPQVKKTLFIMVLGETARAENMSLGGYNRNTNPRLSQRDDIIYFNDVSACGTATAVSVPCLFSNMTRKQFSDSRAKHTENVLDILSRADVKVLWRENDGGCKGVCNRLPTEDMTSLKLPQYCKNGMCLDEILLYKLDEYIEQLDNDGIIVLHQIGSHGPSYFQRYPPEYRHFTPTCDTNNIQHCDAQSLRNTYDNTFVYTDAVLNSTIELLEKYAHRFNVALLYVSDHGESLGENGLYLHGAPYAIAPGQQTQVPMLLWLSEGFNQRQRLDENCLRQQATQDRFSHDNLFHSLLSVFNVQTREYQQAFDLFSACQQNDEFQISG